MGNINWQFIQQLNPIVAPKGRVGRYREGG